MYYILCVFEQRMAQFRVALREQLQQPGERLASLQTALAELAAMARDSGTRAEQFVITVKQEWESAVYEHPGVDSGVHQQLRQALVTAAIKAYYLQ